MKELADVALNVARSDGAAYADIRISRHRDQQIYTREDRVERVVDAESFGFGVRVIVDGAWGFAASHQTVHGLLADLDYSLQSNRKMVGAASGPERDAQFRYINTTVRKFAKENQPAISVDAKKKELVGNFANSGREWTKKGRNREVNDHDFRSSVKGIAIPHGAYDAQKNEVCLSG